ncbi:hypothetical protein NEOLEDRAFT_1240199 [Neolentinus lepideus HHB14362 ss-1]|uniref:Wax synthase domain-containing protein n=1 Tax=Neolentinus lepideus HHB14362 ss-1 TaxID=1314782 RepID=A0A165U4W1_9AGAM|nr:hypothetical protein NEOLEDRAFT_1240199 [Neolentinus lepideus HHB14362 ss-1]
MEKMDFQLVQTSIPWLAPRPLTILGAVTPPLCYYLALLLLPPFLPSTADKVTQPAQSSSSGSFAICVLRCILAFWSFLTFLVLPFRYYVPVSSAFTYQLGLIGWYGAGRVFELFVLVPLLPLHPPTHMRYQSDSPPISPTTPTSTLLDESDPPARIFKDMDTSPQNTDDAAVKGWWERTVWALDLVTAMGGVGWDWATADVRHTPLRWHPSPSTQPYRLLTSLLPLLFLSLAGLRYLHPQPSESIFDLPILTRAAFVACLGIALYTLFDVAYTAAAFIVGLIVHCMDLHKRKIVYNSLLSFPPLYMHPLMEVCSLRDFWSRGWHRLFARYFLVYGVWPGHVLALAIQRMFCPSLPTTPLRSEPRIACDAQSCHGPSTSPSKPAHPYIHTSRYPRRTTTLSAQSGGEWGKVLGAFAISGVIHSIGDRNALVHFTPQGWTYAGEFWFFVLNGVGVVIELEVRRVVKEMRKKRGGETERWYDAYVGKVWTFGALLATGTLFADGWVRSGIIWEMTGGHVWRR